MTIESLRATLPALLVLAGCASTPIPPMAPSVPAELRAPPGQMPFLEALARGVQIYECRAKAGTPGAFEWVFVAPEAVLADRSGTTLGKHYAGPTWETTDGSKVVGELKARAAAPDGSAIPWLLLAARQAAGSGPLAATKSIQRVATVAGLPPAEPCDGAGRTARVPYTATYYFYR